MMRIPSPKFVNRSSDVPSLQDVLRPGSLEVRGLYEQSLKPLKSTDQPKEGDRNFFKQGFVTGVVCLVLPLLGAVAFGGYHLSTRLLRPLR
jgi:hypothetical protein